MHSVEALLLHDKDRENSSYHQRHVHSRNTYGSKLPAFIRATENGTVPDASMRSVYNASTFDRCKPMNPTFMKLGWYDRRADIVMVSSCSVRGTMMITYTSFRQTMIPLKGELMHQNVPKILLCLRYLQIQVQQLIHRRFAGHCIHLQTMNPLRRRRPARTTSQYSLRSANTASVSWFRRCLR